MKAEAKATVVTAAIVAFLAASYAHPPVFFAAGFLFCAAVVWCILRAAFTPEPQ